MWTSETTRVALKALLAGVALALLLLEMKNPDAVRERTKRRIALALSALSLTVYFQFFQMEYGGYFHRWDVFHYYIGSKYAQELGYERLYACTAVADAETGNRPRVEARKLRDLSNDRLVWARDTALQDPDACKNRFSSDRWQSFERDIAWFRKASGSGEWWDLMQTDHGYNVSPVWTATGSVIARRLEPSLDGFRLLALVDVGFSLGALAALAWAFGWRSATLGAIFLGTQAAAPIFWIGGAFMRLDWFFLSVLGFALLRKRFFAAAGAAFVYAGLLRLFPLLFLAGPLVMTARELIRRRMPSDGSKRFFGGAMAAGVLLSLWGLTAGGLSAYRDFFRHIRMHAGTPVTNHMSLRTLFSFVPGSDLSATVDLDLFDPLERWNSLRSARLEALEPAYLLAAAGLCVLFAWTAWRLRTRWIAAGISLLLVVSLTDPSCYYYLVWIVAAPLARARRSLEVGLLGVSAIGQILVLRARVFDVRYVLLAALYLSFTTVLVVMFARPPAKRTEA